VPLLPFVINLPLPVYLSSASTAVVFFVIGSVKSLWSLMPWWRSGLETLTIGIAAAGLAFAAGMIVEHLTG
jgi:vacuolar iron transporter family protein